MSKLDELISRYEAEATKLKLNLDAALITAVAKSLGPSIYNADSETVSSSSKEELETVKKNFLIKKLGLEDSPKLDEAIQEVVEQLGVSNRNKYRVLFYALLAKKFKKESIYS